MSFALVQSTTRLRSWISSYLSATMPVLITKARTDWAREDWQLPLPKIYDAYDLNSVGVNMYPAIGCDFTTETNYVRTDFTPAAEPEYWANFAGNVFVYVASPRNELDKLDVNPHDSTLRLRDDMTDLLRQALLVRPSLGQGPDTCWLEETSVNVNKLEAAPAGTNRPDYTAGAIISVVYRMKVELWIPPIGAANTIDVTVQPLED